MEKIIKATLLILCFFESMIILIPILGWIFKLGPTDEIIDGSKPIREPFYSLWIVAWILSGISGIFFVAMALLYKPTGKMSKAEKLDLPFENFESFSNRVRIYSENHGFFQIPMSNFSLPVSETIYVKTTGLWEETCIILVKISEATVDVLNTVNDDITDLLLGYYGNSIHTNSINAITVFCIDVYDSQFRKIANQNIQQGWKNGRMPIVISFNDKKIYMARQNDGFGKAKYKKLRKLFLKILE